MRTHARASDSRSERQARAIRLKRGARLSTADIQAARAPSPWRVGNDALYKLCSERPGHTDEAEVIAKIWLIGRSYASAIERRKKKKSEKSDDFYVNTVAPAIMRSSIDTWITEAKQYEMPCEESLATLLRVHRKTTRLFWTISRLEKRSLASKYLHFHVPHLFYIYDTRAANALRRKVRGAGKQIAQTDNEYRKFAQKCLYLQQRIEERHRVSLTPRELDNLLLRTGWGAR